MEPENKQTESLLSPLKKVTPLSKYLALALFIVMPFVGGWIGYNYMPEKVVEVEKVVIKEIERGSEKESVEPIGKTYLSALSIKKGDVFSTMVVGEVSSYFSRNEIIKDKPSIDDVSVRFLGETTLVGTLTIDENFDFVSDFTPESVVKLPRLDNNERTTWFRFLNPEIIETAGLNDQDKVEVVIDEYIYNSAPTEAANEARVVRIKKID